MSGQKVQLVLLKKAENEVEAEIWRQTLVGAGIPAMVRNTDPLLGRASFIAAPYTIELLVREEDLVQGRSLLDGEQPPRHRFGRSSNHPKQD